MDIIRLQLQAFDKQLDKLAFHEKELKLIKEHKERSGKTNIYDEDFSFFEESHDRVRRKLRKLEHFLESKIHSEL